jgi:hypothetical protein
MVGEGINDNPQAAPGSVAEWSKTCQIAVEARRPNGETLLRAELTIMREIIVVLVRAITNLFDCLPRSLSKPKRLLASRRRLPTCIGHSVSGSDVGRRRTTNGRTDERSGERHQDVRVLPLIRRRVLRNGRVPSLRNA